MRLPPDSLAFQMLGAAAAVRAVSEGTALPQAIEDAAAQLRLDRVQDAATRGALQDIAYRTMRQFGTARALVTKLVTRPPGAQVDSLLAVALALLLEHAPGPRDKQDGADAGRPGYSTFTVVDQAVSAAASEPKTAHARGLVNAVLRRFLRERKALLAEVNRDEQARWNLPPWWLRMLREAYPDQWMALAASANVRPPMTVRVNTARVSVQQYQTDLANAGLAGHVVGPQAVRLVRAVPVTQLPGFAEGVVSVQDAGAQLAAPLLEVADGMRVLDACAAPGGKTGHLLELADIEVTAVESDPQRTTRIAENLARLGKQARIVVGDASRPADWWDGQPFDRILADVPCSASGIVRRHPDIRWLRRETDIAKLVTEQRRIVSQLWPLLKPGGILVYVTCSIFPTEGEEQARWFGAQLADAIRLQAPGQLLPGTHATQAAGANGEKDATAGTSLPSDHDGFFYARFQKRA
ncbi:16S rRNA (cytosine(967)-C(5))-methyltransferase RsmB [Cupriavidus necator]|uniref:16S rRNA (Cytosine(967)-C(5))-methyltransferase RsmB n=1 Tax=Cupriavidus necator (strain ATCC 17699 / DSM 428 / KCTC 22496 / NCIMB 10442 / H16 / Stanier 337) TaxID=381666 RepID=Q0K5G8_CUPNH|nr:16S rRNA (cytosine(967)-C(5))-methyltransferase RsmB [Cupriavidus necator]QCC02485.1 16S rRNA (cytosine(967)-C(5))-methyltransferase RsmB [Cupriavidus necator H16]QQB78106.1 16S rRNA (cytosine(967)-C(5))-methyltransferase RsmB [Cupriavidus necator]WKA40898.1 16S rRNA (cytosine(967)-C(5))-methyltransferase RsmB [Cupriavidus necator]CAJ94753.1 tRNA and rRNA cytosine-C5-methylase [Cupriavidus necator H16]